MTTMTTSFELMDLDSGNLVGSYRTLEDALEVVREAYAAHGQSGIDDLGLVRVEGGGSQECIAIGVDLIDYVMDSSVGLHNNEPLATTHNSGSQEHARSRARSTGPS